MPALADCDLTPLDTTERTRLAAFLDTAAARRFALCRLALRHLLAIRCGLAAYAVPITLSAVHGKPYTTIPEAPCFNVSHTTRLATVALCDKHEVGIDIESNQSFVDTALMRAQVCSRQEHDWLSYHPAIADVVFGHLWTRKEALLKALGTGLALSPISIDLANAIEATQGRLIMPSNSDEALSTLLWQDLPSVDGHVGTVAARICADTDGLDIQFHEFTPTWLRRKL